jgi:hypothetical protein
MEDLSSHRRGASLLAALAMLTVTTASLSNMNVAILPTWFRNA